MKKLLALLLAAVLIFSFAACGGKDDPEKTRRTMLKKLMHRTLSTKSLKKPRNLNPSAWKLWNTTSKRLLTSSFKTSSLIGNGSSKTTIQRMPMTLHQVQVMQ